jgi:uncharacterized protein
VSELPVLDATEQRILGALLEKQTTVPATYPLTANALRTACNQSNNRDPVVDLDLETVERTARALKDRGLLRIVWASTGRRTLKYHQILDEALGLEPDERALLTVLLLRGEQAPGELRTRTERLHGFADRGEVEACLVRMAERSEPLVRELARKPGQQDARWTHLLGPGTTPAAPVASVGADPVIDRPDELPFETWLLDRVADHAAGRPVVEVGAGPGHVTAYLDRRGVDVTQVELPPAAGSGLAAVLGWYSLVGLAPSEVSDAVAALARPLAPAGWLVLALHDREDVLQAVEDAGLLDVEWHLRGRVPDRGETSDRFYVLARRPD